MERSETNWKLYRGRITPDGMEWQEVSEIAEPEGVWPFRLVLLLTCLLLFGGGFAWGCLAIELLLNLHQ